MDRRNRREISRRRTTSLYFTRRTVLAAALSLSFGVVPAFAQGGAGAAIGVGGAGGGAVPGPPSGGGTGERTGVSAGGDGAAARPEAAAAVSADLAARIDDIEQAARIALRKHEVLEEEAAKRAKEAAVTGVDEKGFAFKSADGSYALRVRGLLQADGRFFLNDPPLGMRDTFLIRRFRPSLDGTLFGLADFRFVPDFAGGAAAVFDAYLDVHPVPWARLRFGKMKQPLGLERLQSDSDLPLPERALTQNLSTTRDVGVQLWGDVANALVHYAIGVFNGGADNTNTDLDVNHAKDVVGRLLLQPFRHESLRLYGSLGLGVSASTGNRRGTLAQGTAAADPQLPTFRTFGQREFFRYVSSTTTPASTVIANGRASRLNPHFFYFNGAFGLLAEYLWSRQEVQKGTAVAELTHRAAHATVSFAVNGNEGVEGVTPVAAFDPAKGAWGALELAGRVSALWIDDQTFVDPAGGAVGFADPLVAARRAVAWAAAATYVPRRSLRVAVGFEQTRFQGGGGGTAAAPLDKNTENTLVARVQGSF